MSGFNCAIEVDADAPTLEFPLIVGPWLALAAFERYIPAGHRTVICGAFIARAGQVQRFGNLWPHGTIPHPIVEVEIRCP
jgi:hypothetical protein